jgi:hypothetical protein
MQKGFSFTVLLLLLLFWPVIADIDDHVDVGRLSNDVQVVEEY